ncbi:MAG: restriction endonuclease subunit S [Burkholderiales bacterium]|nr:restriction endonuclease subunit S [Burkholderiales bacterium]
MNWRTARLEDVAQVLGGGTPSRTEPTYFGGGIAWATPTDVTALDGLYIAATKESITEAGLQGSSTKLMPPGAVLLTSRATIGFTAVSKIPICTNQGFVNFVCGDAVLPEFLAYWLRTQKDKMLQHAGGTTFKEIARGTLRKFEIGFPPLGEQRWIVDLLSRAEGIVRLRNEAQAKAKAIIPALFLDRFGNPATNPKGWPMAPLSEVAEVISGVAKGGRKLAPGEGVELPYMRVANVKDGYLDLSEIKTIEIKRTEVEKLLIRPGDLLMTEGGDPDKLGRAALWSGEIDACIHQNHVFKVRSNRCRVLPTYLGALAGSSYGKAYFLSVAKKTTGIASINKTQLSAFPVVIPPIEVQEEFAQHVTSVESIATQQSLAAAKAEAIFRSILARAFAGELTANERDQEEAVA